MSGAVIWVGNRGKTSFTPQRFAEKVQEHGEKSMKTKLRAWVTLCAGVGRGLFFPHVCCGVPQV